MSETWRPVVGFEFGYAVSDAGRIRSLLSGRILRTSAKGKYQGCTLRRCGQSYSVYVHQVVAAAFLGEKPDGTEVCHGPGGKLDNRPANLRYDTHHANMRDTLQHGTHRSLELLRCSADHELTPENTYVLEYLSADGGTRVRRRCRICLRAKKKRDVTRARERRAERRREIR